MNATFYFACSPVIDLDDFDEQFLADCERIWPGDPTPEEIEQRAAEIRAGWSKSEYRRRAGASGRKKWFVTRSAVSFTSIDRTRADENA
jgi:hypothetical protein